MVDIFDFIARAICHQLPERSIVLNGSTLPFCARCTGIYLGIFISTAFLVLKKRLDSNKPFSIYVAIAASFLLMLMVVDGLTSYAGLRTTSNFIRIISGVLFGINLPLFYVLINNFNPKGFNNKIISTGLEYVVIIAIALITAVALHSGLITSRSLVAALLCFSLVFTIFCVVNLISKMFIINKSQRYIFSITCSVILITVVSIARVIWIV